MNAIKDKATEIDMDDYSATINPSLITPSDAINPVLLNMDEIKLLANFRRSDTQGKQLISETAKMCCKHSIANMRLAEYTEKELLDYTKRNPKKTPKIYNTLIILFFYVFCLLYKKLVLTTQLNKFTV